MATITRKYATVKHPTIEALVNGRYRYKDKKQAIARFKNIADYFVLSKEQPQSTKDNPLTVFWIKGFAIEEKETTAGFIGHFARMEIKTLASGLFTLTASKVERPLATHPQKIRPTSKHPNWGHPVMRAVKRAKPYASIEEAQSELDLLHLEFPEVSIPGQGKIYIIIYEKREGIKQPTHKIAIEIAVRPEGGFILVAHDNEKKAAAKSTASTTQAPSHTPDTEGYFASTEALRKAKRRKSVTINTIAVADDESGRFAAVEKERKKRKKKKAPPRVSATPPSAAEIEEAAVQARFRAAEEEREKRRRRRTTIFDVNRKAKRDEIP